MANPRGFITIDRIENGYRPVHERVKDYHEVERDLSDKDRKQQASRCMDCGVPFCHSNCPVGNLMPEWQEKIQQGDWQSAYNILQATDNFPEFTGRICPALCESGCVVAINKPAVTIRENELAVIEHAFKAGYVKPKPPAHRQPRLRHQPTPTTQAFRGHRHVQPNASWLAQSPGHYTNGSVRGSRPWFARTGIIGRTKKPRFPGLP